MDYEDASEVDADAEAEAARNSSSSWNIPGVRTCMLLLDSTLLGSYTAPDDL